MKIKEANIPQLDLEELACVILGVDYDEIEGDFGTIERELWEQLNIDFDGFTNLINRLVPLIDVGKSPLTSKRYKGFADTKNQCWLAKVEV